MAHHLELAGSGRRGVSFGAQAAVIGVHERLSETLYIEWLGALGCSKLTRSQFVRLSQELEEDFPDLRGNQVQRLRDLCLLANRSEEFFSSDSTEQWLRTVIKCDKALFSTHGAIDPKQFVPSITIQSIVVPCHPYWPKLQAVRDAAALAGKRLYFPSTILEDALSNQKSLVDTLNEWPEREQQCANFLSQFHERDGDEEMRSPPFRDVSPDDVTYKKRIHGSETDAAIIEKVLWRRGIFIRKKFANKINFEDELNVVSRVSHPHVVYSFGRSISSDEEHYSLLMESLDTDLRLLIKDRVRLNGYSEPPFSRLQSIDILLQFAKAMTHMHRLDEPVIHGDLKPGNILVSQCEILGDVRQYLVKVADFGNAEILSTFSAKGRGTPQYAAPELLVRTVEIRYPKKIDVYSFGITAFQVLTGLEPYKKREGSTVPVPYKGVYASRLDLKERVIAGKLRPPLREACRRPNFWNDPDLIELVESCWHHEPSDRPEFLNVTSRLESIYNTLNQNQTIGTHASTRPQENATATSANFQNQTIGTHASQENVTATTVDDAPQVASQSRRRVRFKLLCCACTSQGNVIE